MPVAPVRGTAARFTHHVSRFTPRLSTPSRPDFATSLRLLFRRGEVGADGAFEFGAGGSVVVQRQNLRGARLRERSFSVQHVKLRAGAGVGAGLGFTQGFVGLF